MKIFSFTSKGEALGKKIKSSFKDGCLYRPGELKSGGLRRKVAASFSATKNNAPKGLIFISATAIAVRSIAPFLKDKATDPAVVVIDDHGRHAVSLTGGHLGGANRLTKKIAEITGAAPIITTATDIRGLACAEDLAERFNLVIEDTKKIKAVNAAIVEGTPVTVLVSDYDIRNAMKDAFKDGPFLFKRSRLKASNKAVSSPLVIVSHLEDWPMGLSAPRDTLRLRPTNIVIGIGCRRNVPSTEIAEKYHEFLREENISPLSVSRLATIDIKKNDRTLVAFARKESRELEFHSAEELAAQNLPSGASKVVLGKVGTGGVSEPAALLSAGVEKIWIKKKIMDRVTLAAAKVPFTS